MNDKCCRGLLSTSLALIALVFTGCGSLAKRGLLPEVAGRSPPKVQLGEEIALFNKPVKQMTSIVGLDGLVHLFVMDAEGKLTRIEVQNDRLISQMVFDNVDPNNYVAMDAVEQPSGQLRLLVGDKQYLFSGVSKPPREIKDNRCERFLAADGKLFCAFIISGKEAASPKRTDVTAGWFILVPIVFWSNEQANKLVLAEEVSEHWLIRAVVDPETKSDADHDFLVRLDNQNQLHMLYFASKGGGLFGVFLGAGGGGGGFISPIPEWRYAKIDMKRLAISDTAIEAFNGNSAPKPWISIHSTNLNLLSIPFLEKGQQGALAFPQAINFAFRPLNRHFTINSMRGNPVGIIPGRMFFDSFWGEWGDGKERKLYILSPDMWFAIQYRSGTWTPGNNLTESSIVAAEDLPDPSFNWSFYDRLGLIAADESGVEHVLLFMGKFSWWGKIPASIEYFQKNEQGWSAPIELGDHGDIGDCCREMTVTESGDVFASWTNQNHKLVGRWIRRKR